MTTTPTAAATASNPLQLDIVADTICPWCYLGKRRFDLAIAECPELNVEISWRPFQLEPDIPEGGIARKIYAERKYGASGLAGTRWKPVTVAGGKVGIDFNFNDIEITPNTIRSHLLIRWAGDAGCQHEVVEHLYEQYFVHGRDIGALDVLLDIAEKAGMDTAQVKAWFENDRDRAELLEDIAIGRALGIEGVPSFIFDQSHVMQGALTPQTLNDAIDQALSARDNASA